MGSGFYNSFGALQRIAGLENARSHENSFSPQAHHQGCIGGGCDSTSGEVDDGKLARARDLAYQIIRRAQILGLAHQFFFGQHLQPANAVHDGAHMTYGLDDIARACLSLCAQHGRTLSDAPQRLAQVARSADKRHGEEMFVDMKVLVGWRQHLRLVDTIYADCLQYLGFDKVTNATFCHYWDRHALFNLD